MTSGRELLKYLEPYRNQRQMIVENQGTNDIIHGIQQWHKKYAHQYDAIAAQFVRPTPKQTAQKIFNFLKYNVLYKVESENLQTLKTPAAIIAQGHGDCKHYSLFIGGILDSLARLNLQRVPWSFRFASYSWFDETPGHVFVVMYPGTKNEIWIDPVLPAFDQKKQYSHAIDKKMSLVGISGVNEPQSVNGIKIKEVLKKGKQVVVKVAAAPARAAFLGLVSLNVFGLGTKIAKVYQTHPQDLKNWWAGAGGQIDKLVKAAEKGNKKKRIAGIGVIDPGTQAIITAAAPLLIAVIGLFKKTGQETTDIEAAGYAGMNERAQDAAVQVVEPQVYAQDKANAVTNEMENKGNLTPIIIGGAIVLILLMSKRKK